VTGVDLPLTHDTLFKGLLVCKQYRSGYRFSIDAVLSAHFCRPEAHDTILDLGSGCGIIGLVLAFRYPSVTVTGIEIQSELVELAKKNIVDNGMQSRITIIEGNYRHTPDFIVAESYDLVVSNPPYGRQGKGRISGEQQRARARHEIDARLSDMVQAAAYAVRNKGKVVIVYPAEQCISLIEEMKRRNIEPKRLQSVYSYPGDDDAILVLIEAVKNGGEDVRLLPPFYIHTEKNGPYSEAMQRCYQ